MKLKALFWLSCLPLVFLISGCALMPHSGPSKSQVRGADKGAQEGSLPVVLVDDELARKLGESKKLTPFSKVFKSASNSAYSIGPGDMLEVLIWETAPAILFNKSGADPASGKAGPGFESLPAQMVLEDGTINIPFAGRVKVVSRSPRKIEEEIARRLEGQANSPQVMVRLASSPADHVSVIGAVKNSSNVPLSPKGEKLLDVLAAAGGVSEPINKVAIQLSRKGVNARMPLDKIIDDPTQNLRLLPGDVIAALFQPWTFSVLGATGRNTEVPFEAAGINLAQALSRSGGLNDFRADPAGIFLFRFEDEALVDPLYKPLAVDGKVPVVYQIDFSQPSSFFAVQNFPMQDKDVLYVANMPSAELQKFLGMVGMVLSPTLNLARYNLDASSQ